MLDSLTSEILSRAFDTDVQHGKTIIILSFIVKYVLLYIVSINRFSNTRTDHRIFYFGETYSNLAGDRYSEIGDSSTNIYELM